MLIFNLTKRINKEVAPRFLSLSLRLHESLSSSSSFLPFSPNTFSLLPLAQRLVSIEVQDDYYYYHQQLNSINDNNSNKSTWEMFVDDAWNLFFEDQHAKKKKKHSDYSDEEIEVEAQRLYEAKQQQEKQRQRQKRRDLSNDNTVVVRRNNSSSKLAAAAAARERLQLLDKYIRPALGDGHDNRHIFTHHHQQSNYYDNFIKWLRGEYLIAKYGHVVQDMVKKYPALRDDSCGLSNLEIQVTTDEGIVPVKLPSVKTVRTAFDMNTWSKCKVPLHEDHEDDAKKNGDELASIEHIINNLLHGHISHCGPLNCFFEMRRREDSYELWTKEYIFGLAQYLLDRIAEMNRHSASSSTVPVKTIILDVGAGDGRLAYFLRRAMKEIEQQSTKRKKNTITSLPKIIATDDGSWKAPIYSNSNQHIQVEQLSADESLNKYGSEEQNDGTPQRLIVLCSWMPPMIDWTALFRKKQVDEYILIGEADNGSCGDNWHTWGNYDFCDEEQEVEQQPKVPYESDCYRRVNLDKLSLLQFSRFDCKQSKESMTVSFRRSAAS